MSDSTVAAVTARLPAFIRVLVVQPPKEGVGKTGKPYKFQIYCKRKQESEREVFGNIHSLQYYIHNIHVNIVFFS